MSMGFAAPKSAPRGPVSTTTSTLTLGKSNIVRIVGPSGQPAANATILFNVGNRDPDDPNQDNNGKTEGVVTLKTDSQGRIFIKPRLASPPSNQPPAPSKPI